MIETYDGRRVVIPNSDIYTDCAVLNTAHDTCRSVYDIGIACDEGWFKTHVIIENACADLLGIEQDSAPETIPTELEDSA